MNENVIIYGNIFEIVRIIDSFPKLLDYISAFVDDASGLDEIYHKPVLKSFNLDDSLYGECKKVYSDEKKHLDLSIKYSDFDFEKEDSMLFRIWLLHMLKTHHDIVHLPKYVRLELSTMCQLNCTECYMRKDNYGAVGKGYMKFDDFKKFVDNNSFVEEIEISNSGEVFLNPDLLKILEYAHQKAIRITISNGTNFNTVSDKVLEALVKYGVVDITFSIDGATQEVYSKYRKNGNFDKVVQNIKKLNEYKKKYNTNFPFMKWQFIVMKQNICDIELAIEKAKELEVELFFKRDWSGFVPENKEQIYELTGINYGIDLEESFEDIFEDAVVEETSLGQLEDEETIDNGRLLKIKASDLGVVDCDNCTQMLICPQVNWDGRLLGCCQVFKTDWGKNVFEDGFVSCLNSEMYRNVIYSLLGDKYNTNPKNPCLLCAEYKSRIKKGIYINI